MGLLDEPSPDTPWKTQVLAKNNNFLHRFAGVVQQYPAHIAVLEDGERATTYRELFENACRVAGYLHANYHSDARIGISIDKSAAYLTVMLGCWLANKAFTPLDKRLPPARRDFIIKNAGLACIITEDEYNLSLSPAFDCSVDLEVPEDCPAYLIYTSGSSGEPKGVLVSHNGLVNLADCQREAFQVDATSRYLFYLSTNFDASISDIVVCLLAGATLIIEKEEPVKMAATLGELIARRQISHMDIPPALLKILDITTIPDCLQTIVIGGEACDVETVRRWAGKVNLVNVYGPTEATVCTSVCRCTPDWKEPIIGREIARTEYTIFSKDQTICGIGEEGELYIAGVGLALGYVNNDELTQQKFVHLKGKRYYRTGDRVVKLTNGDIKFLGRMDRQFKIHGQLVEPEEVEGKINAHPQVYRSAVLKDDNGKLIAFVEPKGTLLLSREELGHYLKALLPSWMIPARIEVVTDMPLTQNGKIDRQVLTRQTVPQSAADVNLTDDERDLVEIFKQITHAPQVRINDNFFEIGGDSLGLLELALACERRGFNIPLDVLAHQASPRQIASYVSGSPHSQVFAERLMPDIQQGRVLTSGYTDEKPVCDVFITGCTGFLGSAMLKELLDHTSYHLHCLVRAENAESGRKRIKQTFATYGLSFHPSYDARFTVHNGDVSLENFGVQAYPELCHQIDVVYHCAARVNMVQTYEELKSANLEGVKQIAQFCCEGRKKRLHYASTLSVFVSTDQNSGIVYEEDRLEGVKFVYGGYGQSKFAAERYLLGIPETTCDVFIYRLGLVTGDSQSGISAQHDFLDMFIRGATRLKRLPRDESDALAVDITPIDYAARAMCLVSLSDTAKRIFHIANPRALRYNELTRFLKEHNRISELMPYAEWKQFVDSQPSLSSEEQACKLALCRFDPDEFARNRVFDLFQATRIQFDNRNLQEVVDIACPEADFNLLAKYMKHSSPN